MTPRGLTGAAALLASAALVLSAGRPASGYAEAAPAGFSGGFGEPSCHACHFDAEPNAGAGRLTIAGVPDRYTPGARYPVTVTLRRPGMKLGGFQLTARFKTDGDQAGSLAVERPERERVRIDVQGDVQYANQRREGTSLASSGTASWTLVWTAPVAARGAGPVVFHVAGNAANGDETAEGDYVHTTAVESAPHLPHLSALAARYADRQPDLADLCLIRMSELHPKHSVITVDREDFRSYRRNKREAIPLICPPQASG